MNIPIISIIEETARETESLDRNIKKVGLLAGSGTIKAKIYDIVFNDKGIEVITPDEELQEEVIYVIDSVKANNPVDNLKAIIVKISNELIKRGAQAIIAGCTEIPIVLKDGDLGVPVLNANEYLAKAAVDYALGRRDLP